MNSHVQVHISLFHVKVIQAGLSVNLFSDKIFIILSSLNYALISFHYLIPESLALNQFCLVLLLEAIGGIYPNLPAVGSIVENSIQLYLKRVPDTLKKVI